MGYLIGCGKSGKRPKILIKLPVPKSCHDYFYIIILLCMMWTMSKYSNMFVIIFIFMMWDAFQTTEM